MLSFTCDYSEGAHPKILERLIETNMTKEPGYGEDQYTMSAKEKIKAACGCPDGQVYFITGGTQTNQLVIDSVLKPYEGVVSARTGHVACHEAGAIEYTGHKVMDIPGHDGKICASELKTFVKTFYADGNHEHMVFPGMVYISHPTEYGTLYTKQELTDIKAVCDEYHMPLFLDGARLGYGLAAQGTDVTLEDLGTLCDVFYIGGTKVGALCGEAVVFTHNNAPAHFVHLIKKHGALLAKGRLNGVQFDTLFTDDLYIKIAKNAIDQAAKIKVALKEKGYHQLLETPTNQIFVVLENDHKAKLEEEVVLGFWEGYDDTHTVMRIATSWATTDEDVEALIKLL